MTEITHILCPVDFSDASRNALNHAAAVAQWYGARLTVLHVIEPFALPDGPTPYIQAVAPLIDRKELEAELVRFAEPLRERGVTFTALLADGPTGATIAQQATTLPADLVVLGTHGRGRLERMLLGSVTERVLRIAPCPVLVVPPSLSQTPGPVQYTRIVCPIDFGPSSIEALRHALRLAQENNARIVVLHVLEAVPDAEHPVPVDIMEYARIRREQAAKELHAVIPEEARLWCEPVEMLASGKPYREILRVARDSEADLIVMGIAGRGALSRLFFGSTTNHVVREATCPVLTLRLPIASDTSAAAGRDAAVV